MNALTRTFLVAGVQHRPNWETFRKYPFKDGDKVSLSGELNNKFDKFAIKVNIRDQFVGYVPKPFNVDLWSLHKDGYKLNGVLTRFDQWGQPWEMFLVQVTPEKTVITIEPPKTPCTTKS